MYEFLVCCVYMGFESFNLPEAGEDSDGAGVEKKVDTEEPVENTAGDFEKEDASCFEEGAETASRTDTLLEAERLVQEQLPANPEKRVEKLKKWVKVLGLSAAILAGSFAAKKGYENYDAATNAFNETEEVLSGPSEGIAGEQSEAAWEVFEQSGLDTQKLKELGYRAEIQVEADTGEYIVHVAQVHARAEQDKGQRDEVIAFQKTQEQAINILGSRQGEPTVYVEGVGEMGELLLSGARDLVDSMRSIEPSSQAFAELLQIYEDSSLTSADGQIKSIIDYGAHTVFQNLAEQVSPESMNDTERKVFEEAQERFGGYDQDGIYYTGAVYKLMADGKISVASAEKEDTLRERGKAISNLFSAAEGKTLIDVVVGGDDIADQLEDDRERFLEINERAEDELVQKVAERGGGSFRIVTFGKGHNFGNNVEKYNSTNESGDIGLIRLVKAK